ncbi:MAG: type VI secretion system contractile sheath domain-containing protein [Lacipirellulaceae bacterium]
MRYEIGFGALSKAPPARRVGDVFTLVLLGDFSARANRGLLDGGDAIAARKPRRIDVDNLDDVLRAFAPKLRLPIGAVDQGVELEFASLDDFHPDELYDKVEVFAELASLRRRLKSSSTFAAAAAEVQSWGVDPSSAPAPRPKPRGAAVPGGKLSDFARLLDKPSSAPREVDVQELIQRVVAPFVMAADDANQSALVAAVDAALSATMRSLMHHPDFQALEGLWRSVDLVVRQLETDATLQVVLYDLTAEELAADLASAAKLDESGVYRWLVEQPALDLRTAPPSVIVANYQFERTPPHAELLGRFAKVAAAAGAPALAAIGVDALQKKKPDEEHPLVTESWGMLAELPHARYLGLAVPRFMLRWPYGAKTDSIDKFAFEEFTPHFGLKGFLWGNSAVVAGLALAKSFAQEGMSAMQPGSVTAQGDLPLYFYTDSDGDQVALPCTERLVSESAAAHASSQGFMPIVWPRGRNEVRVGGFGAVGGGLIAGPWAPVEVPLDAPPPAPAARPAPPAVAPAPSVQPPVVRSDEPADDDTSEDDEVYDGGDAAGVVAATDVHVPPAVDAQAPAVAPPAAAAPEDDLDALLASLEAGGEIDNEAEPSIEIDPDLAALLAEL